MRSARNDAIRTCNHGPSHLLAATTAVSIRKPLTNETGYVFMQSMSCLYLSLTADISLKDCIPGIHAPAFSLKETWRWLFKAVLSVLRLLRVSTIMFATQKNNTSKDVRQLACKQRKRCSQFQCFWSDHTERESLMT